MFEKKAEEMNKQDFCKRMRMSDIDFAIKQNGVLFLVYSNIHLTHRKCGSPIHRKVLTSKF